MKLVVLELKESLEKQDREVQLDQQAYEVNVNTVVCVCVCGGGGWGWVCVCVCVLYDSLLDIIGKVMNAKCS